MAHSFHTHLLVFRFSAMGDVAMTVPVIRQLLDQYPDISVTFVSDEKFEPLFDGIPRLDFFGVGIRSDYSGVTGLFRLFRRLKTERQFSAVADLHDVLRTKILSFFFRLSGFKVKRIDKGRQEKKTLTRKKNKRLEQLPTTFQRYSGVFRKLGYPVNFITTQQRVKLHYNDVVQQLLGDFRQPGIGIAPFAKHKEKTYPVDEMEKVVETLTGKGYKLYLFGVGINEISKLEQWEQLYPGSLNIAGELSFKEELILISHLDLMISMDSANMHLASLYGVPVVSVWGATHPFAGFYGFGQNPANAVQADLFCRPCSVFGNRTCYRGDWACMKMISPALITDKVMQVLKK